MDIVKGFHCFIMETEMKPNAPSTLLQQSIKNVRRSKNRLKPDVNTFPLQIQSIRNVDSYFNLKLKNGIKNEIISATETDISSINDCFKAIEYRKHRAILTNRRK